MIIDQGAARKLTDFKGKDLGKLTLEERVEFSKTSDIPEPGMSVPELLALQKGLEAVNGTICSLETGFCYGTSTRFILSWVAKVGGEHNTIECLIRPLAKKLFEETGIWDHKQWKLHVADTRLILWNKKINFLLIDSEHALSDALGEYMKFRNYMDAGSIVAFHDTECCYGVRRALDMIKEVDKLEPIADANGLAGAGIEVYRIALKSQNDPDYRKKNPYVKL